MAENAYAEALGTGEAGATQSEVGDRPSQPLPPETKKKRDRSRDLCLVLIDDPLTPDQFHGQRGNDQRDYSPEQLLLEAILEQAFADLAAYHRLKDSPSRNRTAEDWDERKLSMADRFYELQGWFRSDESTGYGSFGYICDRLPGCEPDAIRRLLVKCDWNPVNYQAGRESRNWRKRRRHEKPVHLRIPRDE